MTVHESCRIAREANRKKCANPINILKRFWSKVKIAGLRDCWIWQGSKTPKGYGGVTINNKWQQTHRFVFEQCYGPIPKGLNVLHQCDNPPCCNPYHLSLGTLKDNSVDAARKGRLGKSRGERHFMTTLTTEQVVNLRKDSAHGMTQPALAKKYSVCNATVHNIVSRKTWKYV